MLLVVLGHAGINSLEGGYIGVDVFFVLSGFLITGLLLSGARKNGFVSLIDFYLRRARRILPAAALTLVVTDVVAYYLFNFVRAKQVVLDSIWASLFAANIHFAREGTDYFARAQPPSPVQHFWSLAVEEQFYLIWPALLSIVLFGVTLSRRTFRDRRRQPREVTQWALRRLLVVVIVIGLGSLAWSIHYTKAAPTASYFSAFSRAWELALGAALAVVGSKLTSVTTGLRTVLGWLGFIAIIIASVAFSSNTPFPGYAALLPTVGTALVIGAGISDQQPRFSVSRLLSLTPLRYVGDRSYAFYLWHWPMLIIAARYEAHEISIGVNLLLLLCAFALSIVSYGLFENPIRRMRSAPACALLWPASVGAVAVVAVFSLHSINTKASRFEATASIAAKTYASAESRQAITATSKGRVLPSVIAAVEAAGREANIPPELTPPMGELLSDRYIYSFPSGCAPNESQTTSDVCHLGEKSSSKSIVVIGDSHAQMWMPAILRMAQKDGWVIRPLIKSGCSPSTWFGDLSLAICRPWYRWAVAQAEALHPDVTLIAGGWSGVTGHTAEEVKNGVVSLATRMKRSSKSVVVVQDVDGIGKQPVDCLLAEHATMKTCTTSWPDQRFWLNDEIAALAAHYGFGLLETRGWFCFKSQCPIVIGHTIAYRDLDHITKTYALSLAEPFRIVFKRAIHELSASALDNEATTKPAKNPTSYARGVLNSGPVGYWQLEESAGALVAIDTSKNAHHGTFANGVSMGQSGALGKPGKAASFDGRDDYVQAPNLELDGPFTVELWADLHGSGSTGDTGYGALIGYDFTHRLLWNTANKRLLAQFDGNFFSSVSILELGWHHISYVFDGSTEHFYVDGSSAGSHTTKRPLWNKSFRIGACDPSDYFFNGLIDEVALYDRALSQSELLNHYRNGR